jgi:lipoprotein-anchoring transpeptidase ErfK/SrfK
MSGGLRRALAAVAAAAVAGCGLALAPAAGAVAAGCTPNTGPYQRQVEAYLHLPVDGKASLADCLAVQRFQTRFDIRPNAGYAGPLTYSIVTRLSTAHYRDCAVPTAGRKVCVDLTSQVMWVLDRTKVSYGPVPLRTGRKGLTTPAGSFRIGDKKLDTISTIFHVHLYYWERFYKDMGFHQTTTYLYDPQIPGSHGCINLLPADAKALYGLTVAGSTPVQIFGRKPGT